MLGVGGQGGRPLGHCLTQRTYTSHPAGSDPCLLLANFAVLRELVLRASEVPGGTGVCVGLRGAAVISTRRADLSGCWPLPSLPSVLCLPPQPRGAPSYAPPTPGVRVGTDIPRPFPRQLPDHTQSRAHQTPAEQKQGQEAVSRRAGAPRDPGLLRLQGIPGGVLAAHLLPNSASDHWQQ